jgi:hypothetical protein
MQCGTAQTINLSAMNDNSLDVFEQGTGDDHEQRQRQAVDQGDRALANDTGHTLAKMTRSSAKLAEVDWLTISFLSRFPNKGVTGEYCASATGRF